MTLAIVTGREEDHVPRLLNQARGQLNVTRPFRGPRGLRLLRSAGLRSHRRAAGVRALLRRLASADPCSRTV